MLPNFAYEYGGRNLRSDFALSGLRPLKALCAAEPPKVIYVGKGETPTPPAELMSMSSQVWTGPNETLSVHKSGDLYGLIFPDLAVFTIHPDKARIRVYAGTDGATLSHLLLDQVLPRLLAWSGEIVIHAGAIVSDGFCAAFVGESGHGKSSMTAGFIQSGAQLLSDDAVHLCLAPDGVSAAGLYPSLRLWPHALDGLCVANSQTSEMAHYSTKRRVDISETTAITHPHKVNALFQLDMGKADSDISITPLSQREVMMALIAGSFRLDPTAQPQGQAFFKQIDLIKNRITGYRLCYPRGYERLPAVRAAIHAHMKESFLNEPNYAL
jgi:hypothetical protein